MNDNMTKIGKMAVMTGLLLCCTLAGAQPRTLTLADCREMAVAQSKELDQARIQTEMAGYDRKIALANYFPKVTAAGSYVYNNRDVNLISEEQSARLTSAGTTLDNAFWDALKGQVGGLENPTVRTVALELLNQMQASPNRIDIATPINAIGQEIDATLHPDLHNIWAGTVVVEQPLFAGGKIIYSNQMAALAQQLAQSKYDMAEAQLLLDVDQAYWQIVSIANKELLAEEYVELLSQLEADVDHAIEAGVATPSDALQVKVKANEARMMLTKATNGLALSKMLLCQRIGLPLDSQIVLADETLDVIPEPRTPEQRSMEDIYEARPETRSLELAGQLFDKKAKVIRADGLPTVALMGAFTLTNPNLYNGFQNTWQGGNLSAGVVVKIPIVHGGEGVWKYKKAKAEARLYQDQLEDAKQKILLQVTQQRKLLAEAQQKQELAQANLAAAEENLRMATVGHEAGVVPTSTALAAHTAWLSAHSESIDAGIELQMTAAALQKAEGMNLK